MIAPPEAGDPPRALAPGAKHPEVPLAAWVVAGAAAFAAANPWVRRAGLGVRSAMKGGSTASRGGEWGRRFGYAQAAAIRPQHGPDDPSANDVAPHEHHDLSPSSGTGDNGGNTTINGGDGGGGSTWSGGGGVGDGGDNGNSQSTLQSPAPETAPAPDVEPTPDPQDKQPSYTMPNYVAPGGDSGIEADPVFFLIDDAAEAAILALLLSAIMATIISEYGWEWVRTHPDQLPDLMIDKLPGWLADQVDKVKDWISQYFTENHDGNGDDAPDRSKPWQGQGDNPLVSRAVNSF
ncbi:hypothetical protein [Gordonia sp. DT30]|uniref:hypothetical protein n=1 Tax=Gordonia sp. DT30 TaxID=3416546 RepID=UPI003CEAB1C2